MKRIALTLEIIETDGRAVVASYDSETMGVEVEGMIYPAEFNMVNNVLQAVKDYCKQNCRSNLNLVSRKDQS